MAVLFYLESHMTGKPEQSQSELKAELIKKAEKMGFPVDPRWSAKRMEDYLSKKVLEEAENIDEQNEATPNIDKPDKLPSKRPENTVACRVTKKGDRMIHTGRADKPRFLWKDEIYLPLDVAQDLEERAYVEIED